MRNIRIGYFADGPWSHKAIEQLLHDSSLQVAFICARHQSPDAKLNSIANDVGIDFMSPQNINSDLFLELVSEYKCDLLVSMSFNQIFKTALIRAAPLGAINCHAGKLPFYRGRNVLNWALINDENEFGITVHYIDEGIDTGDILLQRTYPITDNDNYSTLLERAYQGCAESLYLAIKKIQSDSIERVRQESIDALGFYCSAREPGDELLNWHQGSRDIFNFVRAISSPGPCARTYMGGNEVLIAKVEYLPAAKKYKGNPGVVVGVGENFFYVKTLDSFVKVLEWNGYLKPRIGDRFQ